ncbi:MAG: flavin monoamine oxidase family protein [Solirubrobacterales bacterium]
MNDQTDVIVVGGGFAGVTAGRELSTMGHQVTLLEARDRLGGRTWFSPNVLDGHSLELGGTWVHWVQPHVWAEISRYGLAVKESPPQTGAIWYENGERKEGTYDEAWSLLEPAMRRFSDDAMTRFDRPYEPLYRRETVEEVDEQTIRERVESMNFPAEQEELLLSLYSLCCSAPTAEGATTMILRWMALNNNDPALFFEALARFKFVDGTVSLIEAMSSESRADVVLECPVASIARTDEGVTVTARDGKEFVARLAIVTVPLNVLGAIEFDPPLAAGKAEAAEEGQASRGSKVWIRIKGRTDMIVVFGPEDAPISYLQSEFPAEEGQILVGFGPSGDDLDVEDLSAVSDAVRRLLPDVEVVACAGHNWRADEFARGTWPVLRPGQLTKSLAKMQAPEGRVLFAGSETADGWNAYIDGAIESGLRASREAKALLSSG